MPGFAPYSLPAFRDPGGFDFSGLNSGLDELGKSIQRNKLLNEAKQIGEALNSGSMTNANGSTTPHPQVNQLLQNAYPDMSPAQGTAGAAGRDYPTNSLAPNPNDRSLPASIRTNNPGAMWPGASAAKYGATNAQNVAGGNKIAVFPDPVSGAAAQFDLLSKSYAGMPLSAAIRKWSGGNNADEYTARVSAATGLSPDTMLTPELLQSPQGIALAKTMATHEAGQQYPLNDQQWAAAQAKAFGGNAPAAPAIASPAAVQPASASGGLNYAAGIQKALSQGNIALATQLIQAQRSGEAAGRESQLFPYQLAEAQTGIQTKRDALEQAATVRAGTIANTIQNAPPEQQQAMWQRLIQSHPEMANTLQQYGVDPANVKGGTDFFIQQARGLPAAKETLTKIGVDQYGHDIMGFANPVNRTAVPVQIQGQQAAPQATGGSGEAVLGRYPALIADKARNILAGREKLPVATRGDPTALATAEAVRSADPTYNSARYHYREQWESPNGAVGKTRIANNTAIGHMGELDQLIEHLPDSWHGPGGQTANAVRNWWQGNHTDPTLSQWSANSKLLADEIVKVATGSGAGAVGDREAVLADLNPANGRAALKATLQKYVHILASKTEALAHDRDRVMGSAAEGMDVIDESNKPIIEQLTKKYGAGDQSASQQGPAKQISSKAEYDALPSGTSYIAPDGSTRTKQ